MGLVVVDEVTSLRRSTNPSDSRASFTTPIKRFLHGSAAGVRHSRQSDLASRDVERSGLSPTWKWVISGLVLLHLLAVTAEPFRFFTRSARGTSPASDPARWVLAPYIELAYLNHGYFFFAPEPGPSHLMECLLEMPDSSQVSLMFPDRRTQWPRLLYHRHFMLAEFLNQLHVFPADAAVAGEDPSRLEAWQAERSVFERVRDSMSQHVATKFGASSARIERVEHRLPSDDEVFRQRLPLDSPTLYVTLPDALETVPQAPPTEEATSSAPSAAIRGSAIEELP